MVVIAIDEAVIVMLSCDSRQLCLLQWWLFRDTLMIADDEVVIVILDFGNQEICLLQWWVFREMCRWLQLVNQWLQYWTLTIISYICYNDDMLMIAVDEAVIAMLDSGNHELYLLQWWYIDDCSWWISDCDAGLW